MKQVDVTSTAPRGIRAAAATTWAVAIAGALAFAVASPAYADPVPPPTPAPSGAADTPPADAPPPADANTPPPGDSNAPAPVAEPGAPEMGRVDDPIGGFSYVLPAGWVQSDTSHLEYGSSLLSKKTGEPMLPGQPAPVANDTRIVLGKLDQRLYASAETDNAKAATRLGSDMGEFFMPYPGTRANQESTALTGGGLTGSASYYEVKFTDPAKPVGQIWSGVIGVPPADGANAAQAERWFVVWLGTANNPVDRGAASALTESIRPLSAAPAEPVPGPVPGAPGQMPAPAPAPGQEPAPVAPAP
ncbi:hypothetical protein MTER_21560 [Mycolicibacter terrae]|uniref:Alanine and proline-rich secreted protein Apa n=1 Tax=Mycolicibacter terrae TaxID=1788 RepID=A0AAD1HYI3_9MYCO|nr:APA family fibronectin-binding glycoprotein [Mycolicibacter terrae]ORW97578.1 hypothetical protein AWC28_09420 [Mycolicibacter terrae]BBX22745.1 hypothetical protein MTER_21560 [Mycolicibacter terrae]SNV72082.1 alanine and proline rich secreted protein Apa [Mycolicibacter terrae]